MVTPDHASAAWELTLPGEKDTLALGRALGGILGPGQVVLLIGELGAGKTVLARGLAAGLGVDPGYDIVSPSFTLINIYPGRVELYHADLYRLDEGQARELELLDQAVDGVLVVEWAERMQGGWPASAWAVILRSDGEGPRRARVTGPKDDLERLQAALSLGG